MYSNLRISANEIDANTYAGVDNLLQNKAGKTVSTYVPEKGNLSGYKKGDILIGNIRPYLKKIWIADDNGGASGDVLVIRPTDLDLNPKYLFYVLGSDKFFNYNMQYAKGAKMPRGSKSDIMKYKFSIPSIDRQNQIVDILDRFEAIVHDIQDGLPAEIALRQKQYEYYRDKLLTFTD